MKEQRLIFTVQSKSGYGVGLTLTEAIKQLKNKTDEDASFLTVFLFEGETEHLIDALNSIQVHHISILWDAVLMTPIHEESL
jgi:hypothetical protein